MGDECATTGGTWTHGIPLDPIENDDDDGDDDDGDESHRFAPLPIGAKVLVARAPYFVRDGRVPLAFCVLFSVGA